MIARGQRDQFLLIPHHCWIVGADTTFDSVHVPVLGAEGLTSASAASNRPRMIDCLFR